MQRSNQYQREVLINLMCLPVQKERLSLLIRSTSLSHKFFLAQLTIFPAPPKMNGGTDGGTKGGTVRGVMIPELHPESDFHFFGNSRYRFKSTRNWNRNTYLSV